MIEVRNLVKTYRIAGQSMRAVDDATFTIQDGEMVSIIGHSGSGKTTLLSLIGGLTRPDSGEVKIDGVNIWSLGDRELSGLRNTKISFVYQFSSLLPTLTALENILLPTAFGHVRQDAADFGMIYLEKLGLTDKRDSYPSELSGGQQRRVAIARAFVNNPRIILADEPTGDLDEETEQDVIQCFKDMNKDTGVTFIIVTHNKEVASRMGRQLRMANGILAENS